MSGVADWQAKISIDIEDLKKRVKVAEGELDKITKEDRKIKLDLDTKTLESAIQKLDKMLDSLGKGTGDFKQLESLSKELSSITTEVQSLSKAFGKVDDSGAKTLLSSIQNIDRSLSELSQNILNVNKNMSNMGGNTSGAVRQVENIGNAAADAVKQVDKLADAQSKLGEKINTSSGLDSSISKYEEIVSLVKEYYELTSKIKQPTLKRQSRSEDYDKIDGYLLKKAPQKVGTTDIEKDINDRYHKMAKGVNEGSEFAIKAMKSAIQRYWSDVTEMPSDEKLLSSRKVVPYGNKGQKEEYIIPKKYQDLEKSVIQETIAMNQNNAAYEEEQKQIKANNAAIEERLNLIRQSIKQNDKNSDYKGEYKMGLSLKASDRNKKDIFGMTSDLSQEEMLKEICNMLGVEIPQNAEKAKHAIKKVSSAQAETNISSGNSSTASAEKFQQITSDTVNVLSDVGKTEDQIVQKIQKERAEAEANNEVLREHLVLLDKAGKVVANHWGSTSNVNGTYTDEQLSQAQGGKIIHAHPGKASFFGGQDLKHLLQDSMYDQIKQIDLIWGDSTLSVDKSTLTKESSSTLLNIMRNVRKTLTEAYGDNPDGAPSQEAREHINAIEKEIFKTIAQKLNVSVSEEGNMAKEVTDTLSDVDKSIIKRFSEIKDSVIKDTDASSIIKNQMKDAFQGSDTKLDETVSTAKELDKTLEQVDIPTDSFDTVLKKLDLAKSELIDIVKITKQSVSDADGKFHNSYTLKDSRGSTEIYGENSKTDKGQLLRSNIVGYDKKKDELDISKAQLEVDKQLAKEEEELAKAQQKKAQAFQKEQTNYENEQKKADALAKQKAAYDELMNTIKQYSEVAKRVASGDAEDGDIDKMSKLEDKISQLQKQPILSSSQVEKSEKSLVSLYDQLDKIERKLIETNQKSQDKQVSGFDKRISGYESKLTNYQATAKKFEGGGWTSDAYTQQIDKLNNAIQEYKTLLASMQHDSGLVTDDNIDKLNKYESEIKEVISTVSNMSAAEKGFTLLSGQKAMDKINSILKENSAMSREAKNQIRAWYNEIASGNPSKNLSQILGEVQKIVNAEAEAGRAGKSMLDSIKEKAWYGVASAIGTYFGVNDILRYGGEVLKTVRELDTAYTEMRKVTDESAQSLKNFQKESFSTADSVGTTALALQDATATWMRLGESLDRAKESAKDATVLLNVSEFENIDEATDSLVAMSQAYKELDKMEIIDVLDKIGNEYSISTDQLSTALKDSAAVLKTQGNDLAESVALITAGNAITQDASKTAGETSPERYRNIFYRTYLTARAA